MLNPVINIIIQQVTPYTGSDGSQIQRTQQFNLDFCHSFEIFSTWKNLTDTATVVLPKNIYVIDQNGNQVPWGNAQYVMPKSGGLSSNSFVGGFPAQTIAKNQVPLFMRGDQITIQGGYYFPYAENSNGTLKYTTIIRTLFVGYISSVGSGMPITLKCEDNMWILKQRMYNISASASKGNYPAATDNMGTILADFTAQTGFQVDRPPSGSAFAQLNIGNFRVQNETWAKVFERLRKDHRLYFYFRGNVLRGGGIVYYPQDQTTPIPYYFPPFPTSPTNYNGTPVIDNGKHLEYRLKTDVSIGAVCYSVNSVKGIKTNAAGNQRNSTSRLQVNVGTVSKDNLESAGGDSEFFTFFFDNVTSLTQLTNLGNTQLAKYYYDGFRGKFETFGLPIFSFSPFPNQTSLIQPVIFGNIVTLTDEVLPERNGSYLVKSVKTEFSVDKGFRQEIELHFRTNNLQPSDLANGL